MSKYLKASITIVLVLCWMGVIFYMSSQPATQSSELSRGVTANIIEIVERVMPDLNIQVGDIHKAVRKSAHFFVFLVLGILVINMLKICGVIGIKGIIFTLLICIMIAIADEVYQLYVPGRSGEVSDVIIDTAGALVGILIYSAFRKRRD
ncbi:VanZ family protein [Natranaerovirga pectinivora]|uniref:VanZ family protein n=1 Tax=Natranaerovirga pectinivora TaxID=682400 RepID=A0A4R3MHY4_9FIRM|nr:VanZ family protein [Natranaerovirga pectinivora]TCT12847.1 VanZ family protein [Natranaerovirga pectinivora]